MVGIVRKQYIKSIIYLTLSLSVAGCASMCKKSHKDMTAEEVVEAYLEVAFNLNSIDDLTRLIAYASGNLKQALEEADAATVDRIFIARRYDVIRFSFIERKDHTPREVQITYELEYQELSNEDQAVMTIKNSLNLFRKDGAWFITDVIGGETSIDFLIADEVTKDGVTPASELSEEAIARQRKEQENQQSAPAVVPAQVTPEGGVPAEVPFSKEDN